MNSKNPEQGQLCNCQGRPENDPSIFIVSFLFFEGENTRTTGYISCYVSNTIKAISYLFRLRIKAVSFFTKQQNLPET